MCYPIADPAYAADPSQGASYMYVDGIGPYYDRRCNNFCQQTSPEKGFGNCADCCQKSWTHYESPTMPGTIKNEAMPLCRKGAIDAMNTMVHLSCPDEEKLNGHVFEP